MPIRLDSRAKDFAVKFEAFLATKRESAADVEADVRAILADVAARGDRALVELTLKFDRVDLAKVGMRVSAAEIDAADRAIKPETRAALELAKERIEAHHQRQLPRDERYTDALGVEIGHRWTPISAVGLYVPGGTAAYPSSLLMNAVPAKVAGVARLAMVVPAPDGKLDPLVLAAAKLAGVDEIYRVGGAQAIAALAYGTATINPVEKIVGPGNAYVAAAKRQVFGRVGIDLIAGPSEVLVLADASANPDWIAADLLAQAEHDPMARAVLLTPSSALREAVAAELERQLAVLPRRAIAGAALESHGALVLTASLEEAVELANGLAPEHLELQVRDPEGLLGRVRHAGAVFLGRHTPEVVGDYVAGPNHVLPTGGTARFSSALSTEDFVTRLSVIEYSREGLAEAGPHVAELSRVEGLDGHGAAAAVRLAAAREGAR